MSESELSLEDASFLAQQTNQGRQMMISVMIRTGKEANDNGGK